MADIGKAPEGFPRLMQAARALAGLTIEDLAEKLKEEHGLGTRSLRNIENGTQEHLSPGKRKAIIEACDLPPAILHEDLWVLQDVSDAMNRLPDEVYKTKVPHEMIREAFEAYRRAWAEPHPETAAVDQATIHALLQRMDEVEKRFGQAINKLELTFNSPTEGDDPPDVVRRELEGESPTEEDLDPPDEDEGRSAGGGGA